MRIRSRLGTTLRVLLIAAAAVIGVGLALRGMISLRFSGDRTSAAAAPQAPVAIVFGAQIYSNGLPSPMLYDRVAAAVDLYKAGKVKILLMTGDNSRAEYDEPTSMMRAAIALGVPQDAIVRDYAGRRTYDSCYRAHSIFKVEDAILVTQAFHLDRALMLCNGLGLHATGVPADYQSPRGYGMMTGVSEFREFPAVALGLVDLVVRPAPILGDPLPITLVDSSIN